MIIELLTATPGVTTQFGMWATGLPPDVRLAVPVVPSGLAWVVALSAAVPLGWLCFRLMSHLGRVLSRRVARALASLGSSLSPHRHPLGGRS
jgi:hypothetical protein